MLVTLFDMQIKKWICACLGYKQLHSSDFSNIQTLLVCVTNSEQCKYRENVHLLQEICEKFCHHCQAINTSHTVRNTISVDWWSPVRIKMQETRLFCHTQNPDLREAQTQVWVCVFCSAASCIWYISTTDRAAINALLTNWSNPLSCCFWWILMNEAALSLSHLTFYPIQWYSYIQAYRPQL